MARDMWMEVMARVRCCRRNCLLCVCIPCLMPCVLLLFFYTATIMYVAMRNHIMAPWGSLSNYVVSPVKKKLPDPRNRFIAPGAVKTEKYESTPKVFWNKKKEGPLWNQLQKKVDLQLNPILHPGAPQTAPDASLLSQSLSELKSSAGHSLLREQLQYYVSLMSRRQYPVLLQPRGQCGAGDTHERGPTLLLLAIKTSALNYRYRQAIRQSWGRAGWVSVQKTMREGRGAYVRRLFLLGTERSPDLRNRTADLLLLESQHYGDMLQWDMWDSPLNGTMQRLLFWSWFRDTCGHTDFVLEGDDQVFVNTPALVSLLQEQLHKHRIHLRDFMMGNVVSRTQPERSSHSQEFIPENFYRGWYPPYARGEGRVSSALLLERLLRVSNRVHLFPIEHVYVGMCMFHLNLSPTHHPAIFPSDRTKEQEEEPCAAHKVLLQHTHSHTHMLQLWDRSNTHTGPCANTTVPPLTTRGTRVTTGTKKHVWW